MYVVGIICGNCGDHVAQRLWVVLGGVLCAGRNMINKSLTDQPDLQTFRTVFQYCFVIIVVPVASFFGAKSVVFDGMLGFTRVQSSVYSAIVTVVVLHIILGVYIHRAFSVDTSQKPTKQD